MFSSRRVLAKFGAAGAGTAAMAAVGWQLSSAVQPSGSRPSAMCHDSPAAGFSQLDALWSTVQARKMSGDAQKSWTARLLAKGPDKCAQKVGEEATEVVIEAAARRREGVAKESADLIFHLLVLWASLGIEPREVLDELARREGTSGISEKASRPKDA
mmetsp:Transcript_127319/g.249500  ORF Transcript_127319/g.249500 Transcript_127319/m.249500 type:complete len:158 (-) Transcript_127319:84-557(-)